jgi:3-hydroxyisobutyrate dehydrogenase
MADLRRVGFVGLGNMGSVMSRRLAEARYDVLGFDLSEQRREDRAAVPGMRATDSAAAAADRADVVILMLPDSAAVESVVLADRLLEAMQPGATLVDMSSSQPERTRALAERIALTEVTFMDAPVSGGVAGATAGTLTVMVGGDAQVLERVRPIFEVVGSCVFHAGPIGCGHALKALNNLMSATHLLVSIEALAAATRFGLDPARFVEAVNQSTGRSASTENKLPKFVLPERYDSGFGLQLMVKDMRIALGSEESTGASCELSRAAVQAWERAAAALPPTADHTEIATWVIGSQQSSHQAPA